MINSLKNLSTMSESSSIVNNRKFIVKGQVECLFTPDSTEFTEEISNLEIELWKKSPLDIFFLGKAVTDASGNFVITFEVTDEINYLKDDAIENVFAKVYYKGSVISGENPYIDDASSSNRPIRNITLREGLTNIGTHSIKITAFEYSSGEDFIEISEKQTSTLNSILFDIRETSSQNPLPIGYRCTFRGYIGEEPNEYTLFSIISDTIKEGYAELIVPQLPVVVKPPDQEFIINLQLNGIPETSSQECYIRLYIDEAVYCTPITNFVVHEGKLSVYSEGNYYYVHNFSENLEDVTIIGISDKGQVGFYNAVTETWSAHEGFIFYQAQYPENLTKIADGIYAPNESIGTIVSGQLGTESFAPFSLSVEDTDVFPLNIELEIHAPEGREIFLGSFTKLLPGSKDFVMVETNEFPEPADESPTIDAIETISGINFSTDFIDFLESKELFTINKIKQAGPIRYIDGFSLEFIDESDLNVLQGHVDLYTINTDPEQNQYLIDEGYATLYTIAETPKDVFLNAVESVEFPLYHAAKLHDTATQTQKLLTNLLSGKITDYELKSPSIPDLRDSDFPNKAFSKFIDRCECEDCTSAVSPFSYLVDLLKYGAKHIRRTGSPSYEPVNYNAFITLLESYFFQPFGSFNVDCETLHKEYCRLRLVTEILEQYVATKNLPAEVAERLATDRKNFILLTYKTLLTQSGTSYEELRNVISIQDQEEQITAAQRLSDKLGIPLYIPGSVNDLTVQRMWLTFNNVSSHQELNAENLELIFGFRDTKRDVLTNPPASEMEEWKRIYLLTLWKQTDYLFSAYSREDVDAQENATFKQEWKPIIDPDSFGRSDMTYESSPFALSLWRHRKANTDAFLKYFVSDTNIISRTSVDLRRRILHIPGKNLNNVQFQNGQIRLKNPSTGNFVPFEIYNTVLNGANTDIILKKSTPEIPQTALFQPQGELPVMRYGSVLNLTTEPIITSGGTTVKLVWESPVILNYLSGGFVELISSGSLDIYSTEPQHENYGISNIVISPDKKTITFKVGTPLSNDFLSGNITFIYTAEVALDTITIPDPEKICDELFETNFYYDYLPIAPSGMIDPFAYKVWDDPINWPGTIGTETTYYKKLKKLYEVIRSGTTDETYLTVVTDNLHTDMYGFNLAMEILISCEQYLNSMYSYDKPDTVKLYQMASVFRNSAREKLDANWVKEEIKHIQTSHSEPENLMLNARYFWKSLNEPQTGSWDSSLQTIPDTIGEINASNVPIIDPELVPFQRLLVSPDAENYRDIYIERQEQLNNQRATYFSWISSYQSNGFQYILNHINTGDKDTPYNLGTDYGHDLNQLISDFESTDVFLQLKANTALESAFSLTPDAFSLILPVMNAYQTENPSNQPGIAELRSVTDLFVTACKKKRFYFNQGVIPGWIMIEVNINFPELGSLKYYDVLDMRLDPVRGSTLNRSEWQRTLTQWNRVPTVFPDIVPPENIKRFVQGEIVHDLWVERKNSLDNFYIYISSEFNETHSGAELFQIFRRIISYIIAGNLNVSGYNYYTYFTALFEKEDAGEDIRPYLNQFNIQITEYRILRQMYEILENGNAPLLPSEYEDVINIFIHVFIINSGGYFYYIMQEYDHNIVLTGDDFQNYTPSIINFPLNLVQETIQWRSPIADKKAWKDKLNTRIERKKRVLDEWGNTIEETEDITLSVMRDGLIQALRNNCESFDNTAERISKTLFIETKDNCCVKHSRVSHAIETLQGLIFSLENGTYDNYLSGFSLTAPNFSKEWEWLGSYGTWRSAVFTYIYPENLLYPTLKKRQSPAFIELAETIQNANRFTPVNACQAAKKYQEYLEDIQNLTVSCTANANAYIYRKDPLDCCGDLNHSIKTYMTFYIAQSTVSGKSYYSEKPHYVASLDEHDFWKVIPTLRENVKIIGCLPLNREYDSNGEATNLALWLFFTYKENNVLKLAYIKKDLMTANSEWTEEEEVELPDFQGISYRPSQHSSMLIVDTPNDQLTDISICQNSAEWDYVYFIFSYVRPAGFNRHVHVRYEPHNEIYHTVRGSLLFFDSTSKLITATKQYMSHNLEGAYSSIGITIVFKDEIQTGVYGNLNFTRVPPIKFSIANAIGAFKMAPPANYSYEPIIIANRDANGQTQYRRFIFTYNGQTITPTNTTIHSTGFDRNILSISPTFNQTSWEGGSAVTNLTSNVAVGNIFKVVSTDNILLSSGIFSLAPEKHTVTVPIVSGECIDDFNIRTVNIKQQLEDNLNVPSEGLTGIIYRTSTVREVLYEAYYFVPMLIALDQQQRGDYPTALDWYRSVYDYTNNLTNKRKIFYGLTLEENITNVIERPTDWLLDPLNPHLIAQTRTNAYTKYTLMNIIQCILSYGDREFTIDTIETVPNARKLYTEALDLIKVKELNIKPSKCYTTSHDCFQTAVTELIDLYWGNSFSELQRKLENLDNVTLIEETAGELADIFNGEGTMQGKFTAAFTHLADVNAFRVTEVSNTVSVLMDGIGERMDNAYRYLFASVDTHAFNSVVETHFTNTLATLTSQIPEEVSQPENVEKISWLKEPSADNAQPLTFRFIDSEGQQLLRKEVAFDPLQPAASAFQANLVYSNADVLYPSFLYERDFIPFIDYTFCLPTNPVYSSLELKANLELFKIQNCRNIAGMERSLDIFAAPTDSITGVPIIGAGGNLVIPSSGAIIPSQYRFRVLIERAKLLVSQAQQLESQFLAALEKEDAENYSQLRARQDLQTAKSTVKLQDMRVKQALNEEVIADLQLDKMQFVQNTYNDWIGAGWNGYEIASIVLLSTSAAINTGTSLFMVTNAVGVLSALANAAASTANIMSQLASYQRRQQEWQYQSDLAGYDISIANQQIKIAEQNTRIVSQEREIASLNMSNATDTLEFLKTKFTNAELYRWMGNVLERTYSYMLSLAASVAKTAEQQYYFEQQQQAGPFILNDYWEVPQTGSLAMTGGGIDRRGLTGSARLLQDITKLDQYAFENTKRKLQMTKVISLGQLYPDAFQTFRQTGVLNFDLTNRLFDYDFPGHYLRLINGVKVSVIGLVPVYDNIKATLTAGTTSYTVINANNTFQQVPIRRMEMEQVALTGASRATGIFEFQPAQGEFLNPFEGMGIESRWEFKMPNFSNRMDYNTIADVLIEVDYTALDSFQYRYQVLQDIDNTLGFSRGFSFKNDYPDQWYELAQVQESGTEFSVELELKRNQFPQGIENIRLDGSNLLLHFVRKDGFTDEVNISDFSLVSAAANSQPMSGTTVNGTFNATTLTNVLSTQTPATPFVKLRLAFANTALNRELFSRENVTDILLLVSCKADLPVYPL